MTPSLVAALGVGVVIPASGVYFRYRHDMHAARARLATTCREVPRPSSNRRGRSYRGNS
jgi:hypothetical protein